MTRRWWIMLLVLLAPLAQAAAPAAGSGPVLHAFLDRSHVSLGQTVTLNIETSSSAAAPDLAPLQKDFQVLGTSRSSSVRIVNGTTTSTSQLGIALKPLHAGTLAIPPLAVGGAQTPPLTVEVGPAPAGGSAKLGDPVFMEANVLSSSPYVDQQTVYTVRLFYQPGVDGSLSDPTVDGARLVQLDRDHRYSVMRDGYAYNVIERSWALIPQRTGAITVTGPVFQGQQMTPGNPNAWLQDPNQLLNHPNALLNGRIPGLGAPIRTLAPVIRIDARAAPANAGKPWLPARDVKLKLTGVPASGAVNGAVPLTLTLSISADGQPADALPEPELPPIAGARAYPDRTRDATDDSGQWLHGVRTRSFAIVPDRDGTLAIPEITLDWWDVVAGRAEQVRLPARTLQVSGVVASPPGVAAPPAVASVTRAHPAASPAAVAATPVSGASVAAGAPAFFWRMAALASFALWILALAAVGLWWWRSGSRRQPLRDAPAPDTRDDGGRVAALDRGAPQPVVATPPAAKSDLRALQRTAMDAARAGAPAACEHALLAWAHATRPGVIRAAALRDALADAAQRDALDALHRARWQGGDAASACATVASAFARGFVWRASDRPARVREDDLPPLYPS